MNKLYFVYFSGSLSISGTLYGVLASVFVSLYAIYIKRILPVVDNNVWLLTFYNNVNAMLLFIPMMVVFGEFPVLFAFEGEKYLRMSLIQLP